MKFKFKSKKTEKNVSDTRRKTIKDRVKRQLEAEPFLKKWNGMIVKLKIPFDICVVCGDFFENCLGPHHAKGRKMDKKYTITLCGSCHKVFDKKGDYKDLQKRRKWYYKQNISYIRNNLL